MWLLEKLLKKGKDNEEFNIEEYNNYNNKKIEEFCKMYDLSTINGIRSIPISEGERYSDGGKSVVYMPEQILNRKATEYKNIGKYDLAIECLKKANELCRVSFYKYKREDYERVVDFMILAGKFEEAKMEHDKLNKLLGTKLQELRELQKYANDKEEYEHRVIDTYLKESNDKEQYYWLLQQMPQIAPKSFGAYKRMKHLNSENYKNIVNKVKDSGNDINNLKFWNIDNINNENKNLDNNEEKNSNQNLNKKIIAENSNYEYPPIEIIKDKSKKTNISKMNIEEMIKKLQNIFNSFNISAKVKDVVVGPSIITYEIELGLGVSIAKIKRLEADISLNLGTKIIKIEQVPNKSLLGIEVERVDKTIVELGNIIDTNEFKNKESNVLIALGKEIDGNNKIIDIDKTSHMLISGTTGSGKSVCIHSIINSILYKSQPNEVKFLMIDTKRVELSLYNGIPHLLIPVVTDSEKAIGALNWAIQEIENRYKLLINKNVKSFDEYNNLAEQNEKLVKILIIIDEFADLIEYNKSEIEDLIYRLTQKAEKVGLNIIIATERPSVNIITGKIKANIPTRIALKTVTQADSKVIIDVAGAEELFGNGDMLYYSIGISKPIRIQGSYISEEQIRNIVQFLKQKNTTYEINNYIKLKDNNVKKETNIEENEDELDPILMEAIETVVETGQASTSYIQRRFQVGYARAGRIIEQMEELGIISKYQGSQPRTVLMTSEELKEFRNMNNKR